MDYLKHIVQELDGSISDIDAKDLMVWRNASEENNNEYNNIINTWNHSGKLKIDFSIEKKEAKAFLDNKIGGTKLISFRFWKIAVAASALLLVLNYSWQYWANDHSSNDPMAHVFSTFSKAESFDLPDQSNIILGPHSKISYSTDFNHSERIVTLVGSAFVDVTKNVSLPFIVHAEGFDVKVLGTAFQISALNEQKIAKVSVLRGLVEVATKNMKVELHPMEAASINTSVHTIEQATYNKKDILKIGDPLIFNNTPLQEVAKALEERFNVSIELINISSSNCHFTGTFNNQNIDDIIIILQKATKMMSTKINSSSYQWKILPC